MGDEEPFNVREKQVIVELPEDLIIQEILTRLPVNSVLRFKSVSKHWYSTLSSSQFATNHLLKSPLSHPSAPVDSLFFQYDTNYYMFSYNDNQISDDFEDYVVKLNPDFAHKGSLLQLAGCCNGLICIFHPILTYTIIWNPATRKLHKYGSDHSGKTCVVVAYGFGYASSVDDYKFVQIRRMFDGDLKGARTAHVFSLRENKWKEIRLDNGFPCTHGHAVLSNKKLYWSADGTRDTPPKVIVSFDLEIERFDILEVNVDGLDCLGVMGGALSMYNKNNRDGLDNTVHMLESSTVVESFGVLRGMGPNTIHQMIGFTRTNEFFVLGSGTDEKRDFRNAILGIVDTRTKPMQCSILKKFKRLTQIARYFPSLVSPFPPLNKPQGPLKACIETI